MSPMPSPPPLNEEPLRIEICADETELARHGASLVASLAGRALGSRRLFTIALSGGSTPRRLYEDLTAPHIAHQIVWPAVHVFFTDERAVPPDHADSNYRMAREALLSRVPIPQENVHRMAGEAADLDREAEACAGALRAPFAGEAPRLDLVLLGMGEDGHTASLFPGGPELDEPSRLVTTSRAPGGMARLTLTLPVINAAHVVAVVVSGEKKAGMVQRVLGSAARDEGLPIQRVRPVTGRLVWLLDEAAASQIQGETSEAG
jgi:6-phosphogluconolactonase